MAGWKVETVEEGRLWSVEARTDDYRHYVKFLVEDEDEATELMHDLNAHVREVSVSAT